MSFVMLGNALFRVRQESFFRNFSWLSLGNRGKWGMGAIWRGVMSQMRGISKGRRRSQNCRAGIWKSNRVKMIKFVLD